MKVVVTGATGLIGNRIARQLVEAGHEVTALVRDEERARRVLPPDVGLLLGDITDRASVEAAVRGRQWLFHGAGMPEQWQRDPQVFDRINRGGTATVLEAALAAGVERVIYTSTMDVFAAPPGGTLVESRADPSPKPTPYEQSKQAAEREADRLFARGLDVVHLCPAAVYGPSPVHVGLNSFFIKLLTGQSPVLPSGGVSIVHVDGCARAHLAAAERGTAGERYLLADAYLSTRELAREAVAQAGRGRVPPVAPLPLMRMVARASEALASHLDVEPLVAAGQLSFLQWDVRVDNRKAQRELGFQPMPPAVGIRETLSSLRNEGLIP